MGSPKMQETVQWFRTTLGMVGSDDIYAGEKSNLIGSFNRLDRGDEHVDHHAFFVSSRPPQGSTIFHTRCKTLTMCSWAMRIWPRRTSTSTCGASGVTCWAAKCMTIGPTLGVGSMSTGQTPTGSMCKARPTCSQPKRPWYPNGVTHPLKNSSAAFALDAPATSRHNENQDFAHV